MNVQGTVQQISSRAAGRGTAYSVKVNGSFYGCGFQAPACSEGDNVSFVIAQNDRGYWNVDGNIQVLQSGGNQGGSNPAQGSTGSTSGASKNSRDKYWEDKEQRDVANQRIIQYQSSRNAAIDVVKTALQNDGLSLGTKKAEKLDTLLAVIDEVTDRFDKDCMDIREHNSRTGQYQDNQQDNNAEDQHFEQ